MAKVSQMQGVQAHLETLKKRTNGVIRQGVFSSLRAVKYVIAPTI